MQAAQSGNRTVSGGVPSIANDKSRLYYSSDALIAIKAMLAVWHLTGDIKYLKAAGRFADFVARLSDGVRHGMLLDNVGFPMQYATPDGAFQNHLVPNVGMLFFDALREYGVAAGDSRVIALFEKGRNFLLSSCQAKNGAFYDHYDPGYPPVRYSPSRWRWFKIDSGRPIAIVDNMMMAALGGQRLGAPENVRQFLEWAKAAQINGGFFAYVDAENGASGFTQGDTPYYDVVDSGMYCTLLRGAGLGSDRSIPALQQLLARSRANDGGFRWGMTLTGNWVHDKAEALVTGYWAVLCT